MVRSNRYLAHTLHIRFPLTGIIQTDTYINVRINSRSSEAQKTTDNSRVNQLRFPSQIDVWRAF